jgi:hypothetical protein
VKTRVFNNHSRGGGDRYLHQAGSSIAAKQALRKVVGALFIRIFAPNQNRYAPDAAHSFIMNELANASREPQPIIKYVDNL